MNTPANEHLDQEIAPIYTKTEKKWLGNQENCDICHRKFLTTTKGFFVDGRTKYGPWALMCPTCFTTYGVGLGTGFGQKYDAKTKIKIAG